MNNNKNVRLESDQARWAQECCRGGTCPVCNPKAYEDEYDDEDNQLVPECGHCGHADNMQRNASYDWYCENCGWQEEDDKDVPTDEEEKHV